VLCSAALLSASADTELETIPNSSFLEVSMLRHKALIFLPALVILVSCGGQDRNAINTYFKAIRIRDNPTMAAVSTVEFPERVASWDIIEIGPGSVEPFMLNDLNRNLRQANLALRHIAERDYLFLSDNQHHYKRYMARIEKNPDAELEGELAEFDREFREIRKKAEAAEKAVEKANEELKNENRAVALSLMGSAVTDGLDGDVTTKLAQVVVTRPEGEQTYQITLKYYNLVNQQTQAEVRSRWIITEVQKSPS